MLLALLAAGLVGYAFLQIAQAVGASRARVDRSLALVEAYGFSEQAVTGGVAKERRSLTTKLGARFISRVGAATLEEQRRMLLAAGHYRVSPEQYLGFRILGTIAAPLLLAQFVLASAKGPTAVLVLGVATFLGWRLPNIVVARRGAARLEVIDRAMPELVDLLVVSVESGMGFNAAIRAASDRLDGPLAAELKLMLQEQQLGASMQQALGNVVERADTPAVRAFARNIAQADKLGVSIGSMMRTLALEMRKRRRAKAEEAAQKAPVKILFPLVFLIFPSMFIVLLTPAAISIMGSFA